MPTVETGNKSVIPHHWLLHSTIGTNQATRRINPNGENTRAPGMLIM